MTSPPIPSGRGKTFEGTLAPPTSRPPFSAHAGTKGDDYQGQTAQDILQRERSHERLSDCLVWEQTTHGNTVVVDTHDWAMKELMVQMAGLHDAILAGGHPPYVDAEFWEPTPRLRIRQYRLTPLGMRLHSCCVTFLEQEDRRADWLMAYADHLFSPSLTVMLRALQRRAAAIGYWLDANEPSCDMEAVGAADRLVRFVLRVCQSRPFEKAQRAYESQAQKNYTSACKFIRGLLADHPCLMVLRMDTYFRPRGKAIYGARQAEAYIKKFRRRLYDGCVVPGYLGAIFKREDGISRGAQWHWLIILDASINQNAYGLTQRIGEDWLELVGKFRGSYFNPYGPSTRPRLNAIGTVNAQDAAKLLGIRAALVYMTQRDCVLKVDDKKHQYFRRSKPRLDKTQRHGAHEKRRDIPASVKRLLGGKRTKPIGSFTI